MEPQSIFHKMKKAKCSTSWEQATGDARLRVCPDCQGSIISTEGFEEGELESALKEAGIETADDRLQLSVRKDGRLMVDRANCDFVKLTNTFFSWPAAMVLAASYCWMLFHKATDDQVRVAVCASEIGFALLLFIVATVLFLGKDVPVKGKLGLIRAYVVSLSLLSLTAYSLLVLFSVPVWAFDRGVLTQSYLGSKVLGFFAILMARSVNTQRIKKQSMRRISGSSEQEPTDYH